MKRFLALSALSAALAASPASSAGFQLSSPDIKAGQSIPEKYVFNGSGCRGANVSPELVWSGAPEGTKSFALTVYDPDAPTGSGWWHWIVFNIPPTTTRLPQGAGDPAAKLVPAPAVQGVSDYGKSGYGGPCPPASDKPHRYVFTIYALKTDAIPLDDKASAAMVGSSIGQNTIAKASFTARYGR